MLVLFGFLSGEEDLRDERHRFDAKPSRNLGHTCHYDSIGDLWHDSPTRDRYPSIFELASNS